MVDTVEQGDLWEPDLGVQLTRWTILGIRGSWYTRLAHNTGTDVGVALPQLTTQGAVETETSLKLTPRRPESPHSQPLARYWAPFFHSEPVDGWGAFAVSWNLLGCTLGGWELGAPVGPRCQVCLSLCLSWFPSLAPVLLASFQGHPPPGATPGLSCPFSQALPSVPDPT